MYFNLHEGSWGKWINITDIIDSIQNDKDIQKNITETWDRYMVVDRDTHNIVRWEGYTRTIDEIVEQIKMGTSKIYRNKLI